MAEMVYIFGRQAVCPACSGMMSASGMWFRCMDCKKRFKVEEPGMTDNTVICESKAKVS